MKGFGRFRLETPTSKLMLNVGCGDRILPGFVGIDISRGTELRHDVTKGIPFPDCSVDRIFSEHFLEHLTQRDGINFLRECRRVLKPDGIMRVAMPDLDELVARYISEDWRGDGDMFHLGFEWVDNRCEMLNIAMREWGHQWVYNEEEVCRLAELVGLAVRKRPQWGVSEVEEFNGLEYRAGSKLIVELGRRLNRCVAEPPMVSILIPAYHARFLDATIESAAMQDYSDLEILVCDDSQTHAVEELVAGWQKRESRIRYVRNDPSKGPLDNYVECFSLASGEYIQFLNDDDVLGKNWIAEAAGILASRGDVTLVACAREHIDESGNTLRRWMPNSIGKHTGIYEGRSLIRYLTALGRNYLGEPSACMFRRADIAASKPHLMSVGGVTVRGLGDFSMWVTLLSKGDLAFVTNTRCKIRVHANQWQESMELKALAKGAWRLMRRHVARVGLYKGVFGRDRWPNPWLLIRGYRWRELGVTTRWRNVFPRIRHLLDFTYRVVRSLLAEVSRRWLPVESSR